MKKTAQLLISCLCLIGLAASAAPILQSGWTTTTSPTAARAALGAAPTNAPLVFNAVAHGLYLPSGFNSTNAETENRIEGYLTFGSLYRIHRVGNDLLFDWLTGPTTAMSIAEDLGGGKGDGVHIQESLLVTESIYLSTGQDHNGLIVTGGGSNYVDGVFISDSNITALAFIGSGAALTGVFHQSTAAEFGALTPKGFLSDSDQFVIEDSDDTDNKKSMSWANIKGAISSDFTGKQTFHRTAKVGHSLGNVTGSIAHTYTTNVFLMTLTGNTAFTFSGGTAPTSGHIETYVFWVTQDGSGSHTLSIAGSSVSVDPTGDAVTRITASTVDGGSTWGLDSSYASGSEVNNLEADGAAGIANTEIFIGTGAGTGNYAAMSGDATLANNGVLTIAANAVGNTELSDDAVDSAEIADGAVDIVHFSASGTPSSSTFLRGDNTWATPTSSGSTQLLIPLGGTRDGTTSFYNPASHQTSGGDAATMRMYVPESGWLTNLSLAFSAGNNPVNAGTNTGWTFFTNGTATSFHFEQAGNGSLLVADSGTVTTYVVKGSTLTLRATNNSAGYSMQIGGSVRLFPGAP